MSKQQPPHDDDQSLSSSNRGHHKHRHHNDQSPGSSNRGHHKHRHHDDHDDKHRHHDDHDEDESDHKSPKPSSKGHHHHRHHHRSNESSPTAEISHSGSMYDGHRKVSTVPAEQSSPSSRSIYDGHRKVSTVPESPKKKKEMHDEISIKVPSTSRENHQDKKSVRSDKDKHLASTNPQSKRDRNAEKMAGRQHQSLSLMERLFGHNKQPIVLKSQEAQDAVITFGLTDNHLQRLRLSFDALDKDKSDSIDRQEFMNDIGERSSPYTDKLFRLIDSDDHGSFDFEQYVRVVSSYCMFSKTQILHFCFECFDPMNSGYIDEEGFVSLCKYVNNSPPGFPQNFRAALKEFDENLDGYIDFKGEHLCTVQ